MRKLINKNTLKKILKKEKSKNKIIVFTNGCFDLLHKGHIRYLKKAKGHGDILVVGLNTDSSVRKIKGSKRPIIHEKDRAEILEALNMVDYIVAFPETTPLKLIKILEPDILVKGADYTESEIVGGDIVKKAGGKIIRIPLSKGLGTSEIIENILKKYKK